LVALVRAGANFENGKLVQRQATDHVPEGIESAIEAA